MSLRKRKSFSAIAVFLAFAVVQVSLQLTFAAPSSTSSTVLLPQQLVATLTTTGGPALVNGNSTDSGGTVLTGAEIEAPAGVRVSINLGALGTIDMEPGSKIRLYYECDETAPAGAEKKCKVRAVLLAGCVTMGTGKNTRGQVDTATQENVSNSDDNGKKKSGGGAVLIPCVGPTGLLVTAPAAVAGTGLGTAGIIAIAAAALSVPPALFWAFSGGGENPSEATP